MAGPFPGFPDNVTRGGEGRYWIGLVAERSGALDALSRWPFLRKMVYRLPLFMQPKARSNGCLIALDSEFRLVRNLQGASPEQGATVAAVEHGDDLIVSRLHGHSLLRLTDWRQK